MNNEHMDAVDKKQQEEIDSIRRKNEKQDLHLYWMKIIGFLIILGGICGTAMVMESLNGFHCPHTECAHHHARK